MKRLVFFSGGASSYCAAKRCVERYGPENVDLLFTDTKSEDDSTYRFISASAKKLGVTFLHWIADGRDVWEVFRDVRMMGNPSNGDPCSRVLKREMALSWVKENAPASEYVLVFGISWDEHHRIGPVREAWKARGGWETEFPMAEEPWWFKDRMLQEVEQDGLILPDLYQVGGFSHNNCAGFCIKAGIGHYLRLLEVFPERYAEYEEKEQEFRDFIGKDVTILRDRTGGVVTPITLRELRERQGPWRMSQARFDFGGCGCMAEE